MVGMTPPKLRFFIGLFSLAVLAIIVCLVDLFLSLGKFRIQHLEHLIVLTILINLLLIFVWVGLGRIIGSIVSIIALIYMSAVFLLLENRIDEYYVISFLVTMLISYKFHYRFFLLEQKFKIEEEKKDAQMNLILDEIEQNKKEIGHYDKRLQRYVNLNNLTEKFNSTLSEEDAARVIVESVYNIFGKSDRVMLYRIDTQKQELSLLYSRRIGDIPPIRLKKGDIFDRWVFWKRQPLMVEDTAKDFRFSWDKQKVDKTFSSLISVPIISGDKVLGVLRMDSMKTFFYTQEDLRMLDIISDLASVAMENTILYKKLSDLAIRDGLTSLYVQKFFKDRLNEEIKRSLKAGSRFSLVLFDIDNFKEFNDKYGHMAGDLVLKHIAGIIKKNIDGGDIAARYGGEEFGILLVGKNKKEALKFAAVLKASVENMPIILRREKTFVTISIGISTFPDDSSSPDDMLRLADKRLYKAKAKGKNQICAS